MKDKTISVNKTSKELDASANDLAEKLPDNFEEELNDFGADSHSEIHAFLARKHTGPLPVAEQYRLYENTHPGSAARILDYMDKEQAHRHAMVQKQVSAYIDETKRGQNYGLIIMLFLISASIYSAIHGFEILATCFFAAAALGIVTKFIDGRSSKNEKAEEK